MEVNNTTEFSSNCSSQSESNCFDVFECTDSYPGNVFIFFSIILNAVLMLPLNFWILWLARKTAGVTSSDFVIFNLSVVEIIGNTSILIYLLGAALKEKVIILISNYLSGMLIVGRPLFQTYFCVERYLAVVHPLVYPKYSKAPKLKLSFVGVLWLSILLFAWYIMDSYPRIATFYIGLFLAMLVVCSSCSAMILWVLKRPKPGDGKKEKEGAHQLKRKAFVAVTVILITLVFGYVIVSLVIIIRDQIPHDIYCIALGVSWCTLVPSAAVQPYLYLSKSKIINCVCLN